MAVTPEALSALKSIAPVGDLDDTALGELLESLSLHQAAARLWETYANATVNLVNVSENNSSRSLGDVHKNAVARAKYFTDLAAAESEVATTTASKSARTRVMTR